MVNFLLGTLAGALIACVATLTAIRQPDIQARLGLMPTAAILPAPPPRAEAACPQPPKPAPVVGNPDMLLSPRRFWSVAP